MIQRCVKACCLATIHLQSSQCYLCPRNKRSGGQLNPDYDSTFVFVNDFSAVKEEQADYTPDVEPGSEI